jgi:hypothetical protein
MTIDFDDDLNEMLDEDDHADIATHDGHRIPGIFNRAFYMQDAGDVGVESSEPVFSTQDCYTDQIQHRDTITISNRDYSVVSKQPDGKGLTRLILRNA